MPQPRRWNDQAIDGLRHEIDDVKDELLPLKELPAGLAAVAVKVDVLTDQTREMREAAVRAEKQEVRRIDALHRRFDKTDEDHKKVMDALAQRPPASAPQARADWKVVLATLSAFTVPAAALIYPAVGG